MILNKMTIKEFRIQLALGSLSWVNKMKLADDRSTSKKILTILYTDEDYYVRYKVAINPNTPKDILIKLSKDKYWYVRYRVAENPSTPKEVLKELSTDESDSIRRCIANRVELDD